MYRKIGLIACVWALALSIGCGVYADAAPQVNTAKTIEILKPEVGSEGDVLLKKDTLYVNLRLSGDSVVYMSLYRIDPGFYLGSQTFTDAASIPSGDFTKMTERQKTDYRRAVYTRKNLLEAQQSDARVEYVSTLAHVKMEFGDASKMQALKAAGDMTAVQLTLYEKYYRAYTDYAQKKKEYRAVKALYNKVFTRTIYGPAEVKPTEILRTYQTEIQGVKPGTYILAFSAMPDGSKVLKTLEFKGETSENAVEKMLDALPESRSNLFATPVQ